MESAPCFERRRWIVSCISFIGGAVLAPYAHGVNLNSSGANPRRQIRFTISVSNPGVHELREQNLWVYLPARETPTQKVEKVVVSADHELLSDRLGHSILWLPFSQIAPFANKVISVSVDMIMQPEPKTSKLSNRDEWLISERFIETADPHIRILANQLKRETGHGTAKAIYDWVRMHIQYAGYIAEDRGALDALTRQRGDCTEYAYLSVALARVNKIPARMVGGFVIDKNTVVRAVDYHNWAEMYFDGAWHVVDAQKENWLSPADQYIAFRYFRNETLNPIGLKHRFHTSGDIEVAF